MMADEHEPLLSFLFYDEQIEHETPQQDNRKKKRSRTKSQRQWGLGGASSLKKLSVKLKRGTSQNSCFTLLT